MQVTDIEGHSYGEREDVLPRLSAAISENGGWLQHRRSVSERILELHLEVHLRSVPDLYAAILSIGIELTVASQIALANLCTCRHYAHLGSIGSVVEIRLTLIFLESLSPPEPPAILSEA